MPAASTDAIPAIASAMRVDVLRRLRWLSLLGQVVAIAIAHAGIGLSLPLLPLLAGVAALASANLALQMSGTRLARAPSALFWLLFDTLELGWQLYWSGGPANPFVSLLMVPIALAAVMLPARAVVITAVVAICAYSGLWLDHVALPHLHGEFNLHLFGMWINFLLSAVVIAFFGTRVARTLARQRAALAQARERSLRDEGLLAVASLAAGAAHALNTPLSTMAVVLADLRDDLRDNPASADLALLGHQLDACRQAVRELVEEARPGEPASECSTVQQRLDRALTRWRLLRPSFELDCECSAETGSRPLHIDRGFDYLLINLLDNAADAAQACGQRRIALTLAVRDRRLLIDVRDPGSGPSRPPGAFASSKADGLGLGFALAELICERHCGSLRLLHGPDGSCAHAELDLEPIT